MLRQKEVLHSENKKALLSLTGLCVLDECVVGGMLWCVRCMTQCIAPYTLLATIEISTFPSSLIVLVFPLVQADALGLLHRPVSARAKLV